MKTVLYGRIVFGASAVAFGIIALMWHDADTWQEMYVFIQPPFGDVIGNVLMVAQIVGGLALLLQRTVRLGSIILVVDYALFTLGCVPPIFSTPLTYGPYVPFFETLSLLCGAVAVYAACVSDAARSAMIGRAARVALGLCAVSFALAQVFYPGITASLVPHWIPPNQMFWVWLTTIAFGLAAVAILINRQTRLAARLLTLMLFLFGVIVWVPIVIGHPGSHNDWSEFFLNYEITGACWMVAELRAF